MKRYKDKEKYKKMIEKSERNEIKEKEGLKKE